MKLWHLPVICVLGLTGCTYNPQTETDHVAEFNQPFTEKDFAATTYTDPASNQRFCVLSSGYNGIKVILQKDHANAPIRSSIKSTRTMYSGNKITLRVNEHVYRSVEEFFPATLTNDIIADLKSSRKAYLEWRESNSSENNGSQTLYTNIIHSSAFSSSYEKCQKMLEEE